MLEFRCLPWTERSRTYHDVLREEVITEGAVVKVDFIEGLFGQLHHITLVVSAVLVLADDLLTHSELMHGCLVALQQQKSKTEPLMPTGSPQRPTEGRAAAHLDLGGTFVPTAGHVDHKGPIVRLHQDPGSLGTGGVVGGGTAAVGTLDTAA